MQASQLSSFLAPWLRAYADAHPQLMGAYLAGSAAELSPEDTISACSDIDIMLLLDADAGEKPGKIPYKGYVIEGTHVLYETVAVPDGALSDYHLAHGLSRGRILLDRDGRLTALSAAVAKEFAKPERIWARIDNVFSRIDRNLTGYDPAAPLPQRMMGLLFSAGILCHAVLVAAGKNPTIRMRYRATQQLDNPPLQEALLSAAGFGSITREQTSALLCDMAALFDTVAPACKTPFPFTGDLQPQMRKSAVDDLLALLQQGLQREAMFWICATGTRLMVQAHADLPSAYAQALPWLQAVAEAIGLGSLQAERRRIDQIREAMPVIRSYCQSIIEMSAP